VRRSRPLAGRELWRVGDWGGASAQIGRRWELVGAAALERLVDRPSPNQPGFVARAAVSFVDDPTLERAIHGAGLTNADAMLLGPLEGRLALQPVDFKWSIEVAGPEQVAGDSLRALLEADVPELHAALQACLESIRWESRELPPLDELVLLDGLFVAPRHAANDAFLASPANQRRERPLSPNEVVFQTVDGLDFFSPLPGWELAEILAAQEGARRALQTVEGAERYYRLGAGVLGALLARGQSIFDSSPPPIDSAGELGALRRAQRLATTEQLIAHLDRVMSARSELKKSFNQLGRTAFPFGAYRKRLHQTGVQLPEREEAGPADRRWSRLYGLTQRELSQRLLLEGRALVAAGQTDAQALASLQARGAELAREAGAIAERLIRAELEADPPTAAAD
jgi:hypothetical protein